MNLTMAPALVRLVIYTSKIDQMAEFYSRHFGFSIVRSETDRIVELRPRSAGIALLLHPAGSSQKEGQVLVKLVFDVEDVPRFCAAKVIGKSRGGSTRFSAFPYCVAVLMIAAKRVL